MKNTLWLLLLLLFTDLPAQTHEVIYVKGTVKAPKTNQPLKKGSTFSARYKDQLSFTGKRDCLITLEQSKNKNYVVRPHPTQDKVILQLIPYQVKTRPGYILSGVDLVNYLNEGGNYLVIGKSTYIPVNPNGFVMNQDTFFYLRYDYQGIPINKKLPISKEGLLLHRDSLFQARFSLQEYNEKIFQKQKTDSPQIGDTIIQIKSTDLTLQSRQYVNFKDFKMDTVTYSTNVALYYYDGVNRNNISIIASPHPGSSSPESRSHLPFYLIFLEEDEVKSVIKPLLDSDLFISKTEAVERVTAFLEEQFAGKLEERDVEKWLEQQGLLKNF